MANKSTSQEGIFLQDLSLQLHEVRCWLDQ